MVKASISGKAGPRDIYGEKYYRCDFGEIPYDRSTPHYLEFFRRVAAWIVENVRPKTALDVGCAKGFLVEALRDRGVDARGIDISEYAIGQVREDVRPHCRIGSAVDPLDRDYDLVSCVEVVEHLSDEDGRKAIARIAARAACVLFSSTPDDTSEATHVNVRPVLYWLEIFAGLGFYPDLETDPGGVLSPHAVLLRRGIPDPKAAVLPFYARYQEVARRARRGDHLEAEMAELKRSLSWRLVQALRRAVRAVFPKRGGNGR